MANRNYCGAQNMFCEYANDFGNCEITACRKQYGKYTKYTISDNVSARTLGKREALEDLKKKLDLCFIGDDGTVYWYKGTFEALARFLKAIGYREDMRE